MLFHPHITAPLGFAPVNKDLRVVGGAAFSVGEIAELDLRNGEASNNRVGDPASGYTKVVHPNVFGTRGAVPECITLDALTVGGKGRVRVCGIVTIEDGPAASSLGDRLTIDDATAGRRIYGIVTKASEGGFFEAVWDGEDGIGTVVDVGGGGANDPPVADITATPDHGDKPLTVAFDASGSTDDSAIIRYEFDFGEGNGFENNLTDATVDHIYTKAGTYTCWVRVTDDGTPGLQDLDFVQVIVTAPGGGGTTTGGTGGGGDDGGQGGSTGSGGVIIVPF